MKTQSADIFAQRVIEMMNQRHFTKAEMAKRLNVDYSTFWRKLNGQRSIDIPLLRQIANVLGTTVSYLMGETDNSERNVNVQEREVKEVKPISYSYWGGVVDETHEVAESEDKEAISYVFQILNYALSLLPVAVDMQGSVVPKTMKPYVANMPVMLGKHNENKLTVATA